ncbi:MAG: repeat containing protein [Herbinix sp.]|nr:repeat containing protein [Herbinix sp.]
MKRKLLSILMILVSVFLLSPKPVDAVEENSERNSSYIYTPYRSAVPSPSAYTLHKAIGNSELGISEDISPVDVYATEDYLYMVCIKTNAVYVLDKNFSPVLKIREIQGDLIGPNTLNAPEGVFVDEMGNIYIADTQNRRILLLDKEGNLIHEYIDMQIQVLGEKVDFYPTKLVVDRAKRIYVIGKNINRGIIELSKDGEFTTFIGAPKVKANLVDYMKRIFMTDEQIMRMEKFIPTEYNNIAMDTSGFLYGTIGSVDMDAVMEASYSDSGSTADNAKPVVKLSPAGEDILFRRGNVPVIGELNFSYGDHSYCVDVAVRADGIYSILDQRHGRIFTYDMYGNLLYVFGGLGQQYGSFSSPSSLCYFNEHLVVADQISGKINAFEVTEYGDYLNSAVKLDYDGKYEKAASLWLDLAKKNSNLYLAYTGIGKMYYRDKDYEMAMKYFKAAKDTYYYDKSKEKLRKEAITKYFPAFAVGAVLIIVILNGFRIRKGVKGYAKGNKFKKVNNK